MARVNVYLPDDLAAEAKAAELNISGLAQEAIRSELNRRSLDAWLDEVAAWPPTGITSEMVVETIDAIRTEIELGEPWPDDRDFRGDDAERADQPRAALDRVS